MKAYAMTVICAAFILSILSALAPEGPGKETRRLAGTIFLVLAVLAPLGRSRLPALDLTTLTGEGEKVAQMGKAQYEAAYSAGITERLEAYILTKAAALGLEPQVHVELDPEGMPQWVELTADAEPHLREELTGQLARELGLKREDVIWEQPHQSSE
jgi:hypothetical protein